MSDNSENSGDAQPERRLNGVLRLSSAGEAVARYRAKGYIVVREALPVSLALKWECSTRELPGRMCGVSTHPELLWLEQGFSREHIISFLGGFVYDPGFLGRVGTVAGIPFFDQDYTMVWVNRYKVGDRVPRHLDSSGSCQVLLCLRAPYCGTGGVLHIEGQPVPLKQGDAVIWNAHKQYHWMTEIQSPSQASTNERVVVVARLYAAR